jgi:hypothetical protein
VRRGDLVVTRWDWPAEGDLTDGALVEGERLDPDLVPWGRIAAIAGVAGACGAVLILLIAMYTAGVTS